jgi:hypothetical protein
VCYIAKFKVSLFIVILLYRKNIDEQKETISKLESVPFCITICMIILVFKFKIKYSK